MPTDLFFFVEPSDVNQNAPLIYLWQVKTREGASVFEYVGRAVNGAGRPKKDYSRNVRDLLLGKHWHGDKTSDFREVHYVLAGATVEKYKVYLRFLMNCTPENINQKEQECQARFIVSNTTNRAAIDGLIFAAKTARARARTVS
jgi:hypothetical protein